MSLEVKNLSFIYSPDTVYEMKAIKDVSFTVNDGEFVGLIGRTGSGKSTLIQHLNGLEKASKGDVIFDGRSIYEEKYPLKELRQQVGLVFQYPEYQLFEETVFKDVCFGPGNLGLSEEECAERAREALKSTGVAEEFWEVSPFDLSGGQKRRVAIAGVLAMNPRVLILDEPTAGLDPIGRKEILDQLKKLHKERGITIILVSHSMEDMAEYADRLLVMCDGDLIYDDTPSNVFAHYDEMKKMGLGVPGVTDIIHDLKEAGLDVDDTVIRLEDAASAIDAALRKQITTAVQSSIGDNNRCSEK